MRARFVSNVITLILGSLPMADRFVFGPGTARWPAFGREFLMERAARFPAAASSPARRDGDGATAVAVGSWPS
ncbi:MAG TPA: hypothetical protein VG325_20570 [Solirubrobacteraceae bacterium]|nr:hypothetical protein [Solirubrobacteraceae bacterium]